MQPLSNNKYTSGIGSLPGKNIKWAVDSSLVCGRPYLPELPELGDGVFDYSQRPGNLSCLDEFSRRINQENITSVKIQCVGPATLIVGGHDRLGKFVSYEDGGFDRIYAHLKAIYDKLQGKQITLFIDEPSAGIFPPSHERLQELWKDLFTILIPDIFKDCSIICGIHCCDNFDWDMLLNFPSIDIISFDASQYGERFEHSLRRYGRRGKNIAWGVKGESDVRYFQEGDLITPPCGLRTYATGECQKIFKNLRTIGEGISRERFPRFTAPLI